MRRLRNLAFVSCLAGAGAALAQEPAKEKVELPEAAKGIPDKGEKGRLVVELDKDGDLMHENKACSLKELKAAFQAAVAQEKKPDARISEIPVLLRVHKDAPWQHVQWLMTIMAECKLYRVQFAVKTDKKPAKLLAPLPTDLGMGAAGPNQGAQVTITVSVHIIARKEMAAEFGQKQVMKPTEMRYHFGDTETTDLAVVTQHIENAHKAAQGTKNAVVVGEIKAGHKVPYKQIVAVLDEFQKAGMNNIHFYGTAIPNKELRGLKTLPYPVKNYGR